VTFGRRERWGVDVQLEAFDLLACGVGNVAVASGEVVVAQSLNGRLSCGW
jgi:hypothetical protein